MGLIATALGKYLAWPVIGALVPGINPKVMMVLAGILAAVIVVGGPAGAVWIHMHGAKREAVTTANAACELRIAQSTAASAQALADILASVKEDEPAPKTKAEASAACKRSKLCRENGS